jgi:hypothetical protein
MKERGRPKPAPATPQTLTTKAAEGSVPVTPVTTAEVEAAFARLKATEARWRPCTRRSARVDWRPTRT